MVTFVTLYRGETIQSAKMIAVTNEPEAILQVALIILEQYDFESDMEEGSNDPVVQAIEEGRKNALRVIVRETS